MSVPDRQRAEQIKELSPDLVFLDIQMPGLDGFGMIERIVPAKLPLFIFVTAYGEYAVKAFEIEAVDNHCRPFDKERLLASVARAIRRTKLLASAPESEDSRWLTRLSIKEGSRIVFVPVDKNRVD